MRLLSKNDSVAKTVAVLFGCQWLVLQIIVWRQQVLAFSEHFWLGNDFEFLYSAAGNFLQGKSPYLEPNFIPLPPALYLPIALHHLSFWNAFTVYRTINFFLVVVAILWLCRELRMNFINSAMMMVIVVTYGPFYSLLAGGNLDGLMLTFLVFACARRAWVRGAFLGLSIGTKVYSLLLIPVLTVRRRWREIGWTVSVLAILMLPFYRYWPDAFSSVFHRSAVLRLDGNESPAVLFILLFGEKRVWAWRSCYVLLWGGTLLARLTADAKNDGRADEERFRGLDYLPWMAAAPVLVFTYTGTILLPLMARLARRSQERTLGWAEWLMVAGFVGSGLYQTIYVRTLVGALTVFHVSYEDVKHVSLGVVPLGIAMILIGSAVAAWRIRAWEGNGGAKDKTKNVVVS